MHSKRGRLIAVLAIILVVAGAYLIGKSGVAIKYPEKTEEVQEVSFGADKESLIVWYTDDALTDYVNAVAVNYNTENENVRVIPVLKSGMEYLENISAASVANEELPDLYITTNDLLEKAHLAGLANKIEEPDGKELEKYFPQVAIDSITYKGERIAYPLYFECSALLYNQTYLENWARAALEAEVRSELVAEAEAAGTETANTEKAKAETKTDAKTEDKDNKEEKEEEPVDPYADEVAARVTDEAVAAMIEEHFPSSIDGLLAFSDMYDAPEGVDTIFKWAVTDIFYNYFFIGDSISMGGAYGDDSNVIDIYNEDAIKGLQKYQELNQFFSINTNDVSYQSVMEEFMSGKIVMTIATTDAINMLNNAAEEGVINFEYSFAPLPDIREGAQARSMSVTDVVAVNGYSTHKDIANDFAAFLCEGDAATMYERSGKVSALKDVNFGDADAYLSIFDSEYAKSVPLPKMLETSNYWVNLEMLFASVWDGDDANKGLKKLSEQMKLQVTGENYTEEPIVIEEEEIAEDEIIETDTLDD